MGKATWGIAAVGLTLLGAAGCETLDRLDLSLASTAAGRERTVSGSVESVTRSTKAVLQEMGLEASVSKDEEGARLHSRTTGGQKFAVVLTRGEDGKTRVRLEWEGVADDGTGYSLLARLDGALNR